MPGEMASITEVSLSHSANEGRILCAPVDSTCFRRKFFARILGKFFTLGPLPEHIGKEKTHKTSQPTAKQKGKKSH